MEDNLRDAIINICKLLSSRTATLFIGAGFNAGICNSEGHSFPLGADLAKLICKDLLGDALLNLTLDEAAEYAKSGLGVVALNKYLYNLLSTFRPGSNHISAIQLPWDNIFTTNFDLLLEGAQSTPGINPAGEIKTIVSFETDLGKFSEADILYYKLHGSIDLANTDAGRLILTKEDYRYYKKQRTLMFRRLADDLTAKTFVFVGYSMLDTNFREILEDCREALGIQTFPLSYAVRPGFRPVEADFWRDKYNIQLIDTDGKDFLDLLKKTWFAEGYTVLPLEKRKAGILFQADSTTVFPKLTDCYYQLIPEKCTGKAQPREFFLGAEPTWADIRDGIAPARDMYWSILEAMFEELSNPASKPSAYLITGYAGTGKTTLIRTLAFTLAKEFALPVLIHVSGTPLDAQDLRSFVKDVPDKRIILLVHDASENIRELRQFYFDTKKFKLPVTILLEDRTNQWNTFTESVRDFEPEVFKLAKLSQTEIESIIDALNKHKALGILTSSTRDECIEHFIALAHEELLVALRQLTTGDRFDKIIKDEYDKIPDLLAKKAYAYVSVLGQVDLYIRQATLLRLLNCEAQELWEKVFRPTEGVLISSQVSGRSRHNIGYRIRVRHPVIASIVFACAATDDEQKLQIINAILGMLDPGFREDNQLLNAIVQRKELVKTLASEENQRGVYENIAKILPNDPYVFQHRSILEREFGKTEEAVRFARKAISLDPQNRGFGNTLGFALEASARIERNPLRRQAMLTEASKLFDEGVINEPSGPYGYLGQVYVLRQHLRNEQSDNRKIIIRANILSVLEIAREETENSVIIEQEFAKELSSLGQTGNAISILESALEKQPTNERLANLLINLMLQDKKPSQETLPRAMKIAKDGIKCNSNSWRLYRQMGRLHVLLNSHIDLITENYEASIRNNRKNARLYITLASILFRKQEYEKADAIFKRANQLTLTSQEKHKIYEWFEENGKKKLFVGRVEHISGAGAFALAIPENFSAFFWRHRTKVASLVKGDKIQFFVGFNCRGAVAIIEHVVGK